MAFNLRKKQTGAFMRMSIQPHRALDGCLARPVTRCTFRCPTADVVLKILSLNNNQTANKDPASIYKVLVLDRFTKDVIAPLLRVSDLRKQGVTLHLTLEAERQAIPDVPAIYLVQPTLANIERIGADAGAALYDIMHLHFASALPTRLMEQLAASVVKAGVVNRIGKLFDQYLSFIALEPNLFSLGLPDSYVQLNDPSAADHQIEVCMGARPPPICIRMRAWKDAFMLTMRQQKVV